jgi:hypothetical protein
MSAYLIVRAQMVDPAVKQAFDRWYQDEHLPDAQKAFKVARAFRAWSQSDSAVHYAYYEFTDATSAHAIRDTEGFKRLVAEFDRVWGDKVTRSREVVEIVQAIG